MGDRNGKRSTLGSLLGGLVFGLGAMLLIGLGALVHGRPAARGAEKESGPDVIKVRYEKKAEEAKVGLKEGKLAPNFAYVTLAGEKGRLSELRGRPVVLYIWATWCPVCLGEMEELEETYRRLKKDYDFELLAMAAGYRSSLKAVRRVRDRYKLSFPLLFDPDSDVWKTYDPDMLTPTFYFIDGKGRVVRANFGPLPLEEVEEFVRQQAPKREEK